MKKCLFISCIFLFGQFLFAQRNFAEAEEAFRNKNYKSAENYFKTISNRDSSYAEAQYMLAKIYFESDYKSIRKSMAFINAALLVKPNELRYLVAKLELLRSPSNNYISEILKDAQRRDISRKILKIDAQNAFANEELGNTYMKDYVRFKNAFSVVNVDAYEGRTETAPRRFNAFDSNEKMNEFGGEGTIGDKPNPFAFANSLEGAQVESQNELNKIIQQQIDITKLGDLSQTDQFDLELLKSLGIPITDLSARSVFAYQKAVEYFTIAKNSDPLRRSVYTQLMQIYFEKEDWKEALDLSKNMYGFFPEDEMTWLYLGATQFYMKDYENAARSFETAKKYLKPELIEAFDDISLLLRKNDLPKYQADKEGYRQRFWNAQNPRFLTTYNERKLEHYARITYADLITAAPKVEKRGWETVRGQVIIRYGKPKINIMMEKTNRMASQGYVDGEINYLNDRNYNNNLQLDKFISVENPTHLYNIWKYDGFSFVFFDALKNNNYQLYSPTADEATLGIDVAKSDYQMIADELFAKTPEVYQYKAPNRQVELPYLVNTFKGKNAQTDVYVHAGIPINEYNTALENIPLNVTLGTFLIDNNQNIIAENKQTFYGLRTAQIQSFKEQNLWLYTVPLKGTSGEQQVSVEFETPGGATVGYQRKVIDVTNYSSNDLLLSDAMLAYKVAESFDGKAIHVGDIVRNGLSITPAPWSVFARNKAVYLYFEVYNLTQQANGGTQFEVEASVVPKETARGIARAASRLFGSRRRGVSTKFVVNGDQKDDGQYLELDVNGQETGVYNLTLKITDKATGKTVERNKELFLE